jgi:hypothetical protein
MMHLARFTGAPPARAEELVAQIAAAVEVFSLLAPDDARSTSPDPSHPAPLTTPTLPSNPQEIDHGILLAKP